MRPGAGPANTTKPSSTSGPHPSWRWATRPGRCSTRQAGRSGGELLLPSLPQVPLALRRLAWTLRWSGASSCDQRGLHGPINCQGFWKASRGGSRFLQITGEQWGSLASLQLVLDEPPEALYNKWIKERMEFYKRVEPCAAARDERLELVGKMNQRMRFSTSNNLGSVSDAIWQVILCNEEMRGIRAIQQVAQKVTAAA